jgi:hypothetical protein
MTNNVALDVFIGLTFIYLLYSLFTTILQEIFAQWFSLRSRMLNRAMRRMLEDATNRDNSFFGFFDSLATLFTRFFEPIKDDENVVKLFYQHPSIKYLGENNLFSKPAYLHSHNFSQTIIQLLRGDQYDGRTQSESTAIEDALNNNHLNLKPETLRHIRLLFSDARQDSYQFKLKLEDWFDETMQRCNGWYKKQTQSILLILGFCLAWAFNVDSIAISKILIKDKVVRDQIVQMAISKQKEYGEILDSIKKTTVTTKQLNGDTALTITETITEPIDAKEINDRVYEELKNDANQVQAILGLKGSPETIAKYQPSTGLMILGWIITAMAISLGSSFWFDLLNKLIKLRGAGTKPNGAEDTDLMKNKISPNGRDSQNLEIKG